MTAAGHSHTDGRCALSRRAALLALAAIGAGTALPWAPARAEDLQDPAPRRVDVHHHFFPPVYLARMPQIVRRPPSPVQRDWSQSRVLEHMDATGVATAVLSVSPWGPWFKDAAEARNLARICNDYAAQMNRDHKGRFGLFAAMPLPDIGGTLKEIAYAFDALKADGVGLMTSYGDKWPGDPAFAPVFEELDRRKAVVFIHPNTPECCGNLVPDTSPAMLEWPYDTGRAVASLLFGGALVRYRNIRFIFCHAGGPVPALAGRIVNMSRGRKDLEHIAPNGIMRELTRLYYDTANAYFLPTMAALLDFVPTSQILFGSDYPYYTLEQNLDGLGQIPLTRTERRAIDRGNAARLLPHLAA